VLGCRTQIIGRRKPLGINLGLRSQLRAVGFVRLCRVAFSLRNPDPSLFFLSQVANDWITTRCIQEEGFPKVLYAATAQLGISDHPEYVGRQFVEDGTEYCEVTVHLGANGSFSKMGPWCVTPTGSRLSNTYQLVARKNLKCLY
jgi:hypothetical protein